MVLKAMDAYGNGNPTKVAAAITYAVDHGADIINLSMNGRIAMSAIDTALAYAKNHNVLVAISSGNSMKVGPAPPSNDALTLDNVISVGGSMSLSIEP
jgi:subtilisin family serine protease